MIRKLMVFSSLFYNVNLIAFGFSDNVRFHPKGFELGLDFKVYPDEIFYLKNNGLVIDIEVGNRSGVFLAG